MPEEFKREDRYIVIKRRDLNEAQFNALDKLMRGANIRRRESVVVEFDWPEYETVYTMLEDRATGRLR